ncbi:MAG: DUF4382 domain-containing protein [Planctomycetota bacterium]
MRRLLSTITFLALALLPTLLPACGGGGSGGGGTAGFTNFDLLLTDTPADDLLSFRATVDEVHLVIQGGGETANLLAGPVSLDLLALQGSFAWIASQDLPDDTYTGVHLVFAPGSYDARQNDGTTVAVNSTVDDVTFEFVTPLVLTVSGYKKVVVDVDLASSLSGAVGSPPIVFDPQGSADDDSSTSSHELDELKGLVSTHDAAANTLVVDGFADRDSTVALGQVLVRVPSTTVLVADDGSEFASRTAFFDALVDATTRLEVHGTLVSGAVTATRIEVEDNTAGGGEDNLVKMRGLVLAVNANDFEMSIGSVDQGEAIVMAANGGSVPATQTVDFDETTIFYGSQNTITTSAALVVGARVQAKFSTYTNSPFLASRVEVEDEGSSVENQGTITSLSGLPSTITLHLDATSPAVLAGQVSTSSTDVAVTITGAAIKLDTSGRPTIASSALQTTLNVGVQGTVGGTALSPTINASELEIHAGELSDAIVGTIDSNAATFTTSGGSIEEPFGPDVSDGPQDVLIASNCVFTGDATTRSAFWALFDGLDAFHVLEVRVKGLGTGTTNEIRAYEIRARVLTRF